MSAPKFRQCFAGVVRQPARRVLVELMGINLECVTATANSLYSACSGSCGSVAKKADVVIHNGAIVRWLAHNL